MASPQSGPPPTTTTDEVLQQQPPGPESATNASGTGITGTSATAPNTSTAVLGQKKGMITRALKSAAKLPKRAVRAGTTSSASAANATTTAATAGEGGEQPTLDSVASAGGGEGISTTTAPPTARKSKFRSRYKDKGGVDPTSVSRMKPKKTRRIKVFGHGKNRVDPKPDEEPLALVRVRVVGCKDLRSGDSNGLSDP